jgi:hypothetical protein
MPIHRGEAEIVATPRTAPPRREAAMDESLECSLASVATPATLGAVFCEFCVIQLNLIVLTGFLALPWAFAHAL